jgi:hypothetical protein
MQDLGILATSFQLPQTRQLEEDTMAKVTISTNVEPQLEIGWSQSGPTHGTGEMDPCGCLQPPDPPDLPYPAPEENVNKCQLMVEEAKWLIVGSPCTEHELVTIQLTLASFQYKMQEGFSPACYL